MTPINLVPEKVETITLACCILHNFLRSKVVARSIYMPPGSVDTENANTHIVQCGQWHEGPQSTGLQPFAQQGSNRHSSSAKHLQDKLCHTLCPRMEVYHVSGIWRDHKPAISVYMHTLLT